MNKIEKVRVFVGAGTMMFVLIYGGVLMYDGIDELRSAELKVLLLAAFIAAGCLVWDVGESALKDFPTLLGRDFVDEPPSEIMRRQQEERSKHRDAGGRMTW